MIITAIITAPKTDKLMINPRDSSSIALSFPKHSPFLKIKPFSHFSHCCNEEQTSQLLIEHKLQTLFIRKRF